MTFTLRDRSRVRLSAAVALAMGILPLAGIASAQMVEGLHVPEAGEVFGINVKDANARFKAVQTACTSQAGVPLANILWPGDQPKFTFQVQNLTDQPLNVKGKMDVIQYGTKGRPGDIWVPEMFKIADGNSVPVEILVGPKGYANITLSPAIPAAFGAYALVLDLGDAGRSFLATCVRTFKPDPKFVRLPRFCTDVTNVDVLSRLGVSPNRFGMGYKCTTDRDFDEWFKKQDEYFAALKKANLTITVEYGGGGFYHACQPLGRPRTFLDANGKMVQSGIDIVWTPDYDPDFRRLCKLVATTWGYPKGPVVAVKLWNEPWNGGSIAGWGSDDERYREIFTAMAQGTEDAIKDAGVQVLIGGCDSSSNTFDKLFSDGSAYYLKWLDFVSIHYQGMHPASTVKMWVNRKGPNGRVLIWDTESWVANTDDRVAAVIATNYSTGHDRAVGVYHGNIAAEEHDRVFDETDKPKNITHVNAWSVAASVGAAQHFLGQREFKELLFQNGLPWANVFKGLPDETGEVNEDDGTVVVIGDIGASFERSNVLFRTVRGLGQYEKIQALRKQLADLPADANKSDRKALTKVLAAADELSGAKMSIKPSPGCQAYDFYGNAVAAGKDGNLVIPLDARGFYLRADSKRKGSFAQLLDAIRAARIEGLEPIEAVCMDMTAPIDQKPVARLKLTNVLNRKITGTLSLKLGALGIDYPKELSFEPWQTQTIEVKITGGAASADNAYPLALAFDAGADGKKLWDETLHVNYIAKRTIKIDGNLDDWKDVIPQTVVSKGAAGPTLQEAAWLPYKKFDESVKTGLATAYLAYDDQCFYFAAKIADSTPDEGMMRFETRDDSEFFYPPTCYEILLGDQKDPNGMTNKHLTTWFSQTKDARLLARPGDANERASSAWVADNKYCMSFDLAAADNKPHQLAVYVLDGDRRFRIEKVQVEDANTGALLDERSVSDYDQGKYLVWNFRGAVRVKAWTQGECLGQMSGIFVDPPAKDAAVPAGPGAVFVKQDCLTQGNWAGVYGAEGYAVAGGESVTEKVQQPGGKTEDKRIVRDAVAMTAAVKFSFPDRIRVRMDYTWPPQFRRYTYSKEPQLPTGNAPNHDNVQIAFNVLPEDQKPWLPNPPGTPLHYTGYWDTDYEYALNPVADQYGGGTEIWRIRVPGSPNKHFYPRERHAPTDGAVKDGKLVIVRQGNTRLVECAIPWTEMPEVKKKIDAGGPIKFTYRVNDNGGVNCMELARERTVAKRNGSFKADWVEHWANELEFGLEK